MKHSMKSIFFFSAPDENAIAFGETFPSNIYYSLTIICCCLSRVYLPSQPARNIKFASGPSDLLLSYFSVFSKENSFSCCSLQSAGSGSNLVVPPCNLPISTFVITVRFLCSLPFSSIKDSMSVLTTCVLHNAKCHVLGSVCLLVVSTEVMFSVCLQSTVSQVHAGLNPKPVFLRNKTWKLLPPLYTGCSNQIDQGGQAHQSCCSFIVPEIFLLSDDPVLLWQQLCLPRAVPELSCGWEGNEEQEKYGIRSSSRFWQQLEKVGLAANPRKSTSSFEVKMQAKISGRDHFKQPDVQGDKAKRKSRACFLHCL